MAGNERVSSLAYWRSREAAAGKSLQDFPGFRYDPGINADLELDPRVLLFVLQQQAKHAGKEIAGFATVEDGCVDWICYTSVGEGASVTTTSSDETWAALQLDDENKGRSLRLQWHTHPGFGTFWSGTDTSDQYARIDALMDISNSGDYWFIVFDPSSTDLAKTEALVRRVTWEDHRARYCDGVCSVGSLHLARRVSSSAITKPATGYSYTRAEGDWEQYGFSGSWQGGKAKEQTAKKAEAGNGTGGTALAAYNPPIITTAERLAKQVNEYIAKPTSKGLNQLSPWEVYAGLSYGVKNEELLVAVGRLLAALKEAGDLGTITGEGIYRANGVPDTLASMSKQSFGDFFGRLQELLAKDQQVLTNEEVLEISIFDRYDGIPFGFIVEAIEDGKNPGVLSPVRLGKIANGPGFAPYFSTYVRLHDCNCIRASQGNTSLAHMITRPMSPDDVSNAGSQVIANIAKIMHAANAQAIPGVFANMTTFQKVMYVRALGFWNAGTYATAAAQVGANLAVGSEETESANTIIECIIDHCKSLSEKDDAISITEVIQAYDILFDGMTAAAIQYVLSSLAKRLSSLDANTQWIIYLLFTGHSGFIPIPLLLIESADMSPATRYAWVYDLMQCGIGRFLSAAMQDILYPGEDDNVDDSVEVIDVEVENGQQ